MKKGKKVLGLVMAAALLVTASVLGTLAYLTSTDDVTNTFVIGSVVISLDEADVNTAGQPLDKDGNVVEDVADAARDEANQYKLMPGHTYTKDPTVHFDLDSEASWLFVKVENGISAYEAVTVSGGYTTIAEQITTNGWTALDATKHPGVYYREAPAKTDEDGTNEYRDYVVFEEFKIADAANDVNGWNSITAENTKVNVTAYAVQKDGFDTASAAWEATFGKTAE